MKLEELYKNLNKNPSLITEIEVEIQRFIRNGNLNETYLLFNSQLQDLKIIAIKIIEERIKLKKSASISLKEEIDFMKLAVKSDSLEKSAEVYALLGLYEWPKLFPDFFQTIIDLISLKQVSGYKTLLNFLTLVNYSQEINGKRKNELKKALGVICKIYMQLFEDDFAEYIIPILTESLKILPRDFDYSIVYRKGFKYPESTVEFLCEIGESVNIADVIELVSKMPVSVSMLMYLTSIKNKSPNVQNVAKMYEYVYKGLRLNLNTFVISLEFWIKFFGTKNKETFVNQILTEILTIFVNLPDLQKSEIESDVYSFLNVITKNYPEEIFYFVMASGNALPRRLGIFFVKKLFDQYKSFIEKNIPTNINFTKFKFEDPILTGIILELCNDSHVVNLINFIDFSDKDASKLVVRVIRKYSLSTGQIQQILEKAKSLKKDTGNEIIVECCIKLNNIESFDGEWDQEKVIRFFYYLKRVPEKLIVYKMNFYEQFFRKSSFDRCFSILKMLGEVSVEMHKKIYDDIYNYPYEDLNCFNRDLLIYLKIQDPYIRRETDRILQDWAVIEDTKSLIACTKSLLSVINDGVTRSNDENRVYASIDSLFELSTIDDAGIARRVAEIFCNYKNLYDVTKAIYFFMVTYNSSFMEGAHLNVSIALTKCIKEECGPAALHAVLGDISLESCKNLQEECLKCNNNKKAQVLVRTFLQNFKGKPISKLYANDFKVKEQNFIDCVKKSNNDNLELIIDKTFF